MANPANVLVRNETDETKGETIKVTRKQPDGTPDYETVLSPGQQEEIQLQSPDLSLVIDAPEGKDAVLYLVKVDAATTDLEQQYSRNNGNWTFKVFPDQDGEIPTTVNISVGNTEPET
jgi:hypothetical protein